MKWTAEHMCADAGTVFVMGFSNGGMMSNRVGCEAADLVRAIGPGAGNIKASAFGDFKACKPSRPVGYIGFCGSADSVCKGDAAKTLREWASQPVRDWHA